MVFEFLQSLRFRTYHKDSYMAHRGDCLGQEGRYRRTASPDPKGPATMDPVALTPREEFTRGLLKDEEELSSLNSAWEKSSVPSVHSTSTVIFTSDALKKIRRQGRGKVPPEVAPKPKFSCSTLAVSSIGLEQPRTTSANLSHYKSTPALNLPPRWKNSLDSLDTASTVSSSPKTAAVDRSSSSSSGERPEWKPERSDVVPTTAASAHSHSNSDSGLSSLSNSSGRTSTMSPVSTMSTVSSVSSTSSGSSRHSLRSSSIVSQCTVEDVSATVSPPESFTRIECAETGYPGRDSVNPDSGNPDSGTGRDSGTGTLKKQSRRKFQEEIDCEELSKEFVRHLPQSNAKLQSLFVTSPTHKTLADYVEGILELDLEDGSQPQRRHLSPSILKRKIEELKEAEKRLTVARGRPPLQQLNGNRQTGEGRKDMNTKDGLELQRKKEELLDRISKKLDVLRAEQLSLKEEMALNEELGREVSGMVHQVAKPNECEKFRLHVEEIEKITSLLLGLSGRLARIENTLASLDTQSRPEEKKLLESKRDKLADQLDEAKSLKENIDRRSQAVSGFLHKYLSNEQFADYDHFVKMKAKLIMDSREIGDKIKLGEEQLMALKDALYSAQQAH